MLKKLIVFFGNRLREPSTWLGLIFAIAGALNVALDATQANAIAAAVAAVIGAILTFIKAKDAPDRKPHEPADPSIPDAAVVHDSADDAVQSVDLTHERTGVSGGARDKFRHRNEQ